MCGSTASEEDPNAIGGGGYAWNINKEEPWKWSIVRIESNSGNNIILFRHEEFVHLYHQSSS